MSFILQQLKVAAAFCLVAAVVIIATFWTAPRGNTSEDHFDTLIVLGCPANPDGTSSAEERARVLGAVEEFKAGRAQHIIFTGGAAHNRYVEGEVMAQVATAAGVPASAIVIEGRAHNTVENIWFSRQIMQARGWHSAEVISDPAHVHRAGLILSHYTQSPYAFTWQTHPAPFPPGYGPGTRAGHWLYETLAYNRVRWGGFPASERPYLPGS